MNKRVIIVLSAIIVTVAALGVAFITMYANKATITIDYSNASEVQVFKEDDLVATASGSPFEIDVKKGSTVVVKTKGNEGYADTEKVIPNINSDQGVSISPYFSQSKLDTLLDGERAQIDKVLRETYVTIFDKYKKKYETLYRFGDWYGLVIERKPGWLQNGDDQRIALQKSDDTWKVVAGPSLYLNTYNNRVVPIEIQDDLNTN